ncbi:response regulator [Chitinimonas lacunae]|uniref:histidine kinase n=1 Tax=Chitinimonas lacunae TaxID=1963018 RepID=A0ABV8MJM1_9NEIS
MMELLEPSSPVRILIAEDSPAQAEQLRYLLESQHFSVLMAGNGRIALETASRQRPNIIITDVVMPEMDGYELCAAIKADPALRDIPVVIVTALSNWDDMTRSLECGADNFLRKPYDPQILVSRLNHILMNQELRRRRPAQSVEAEIPLLLDGKTHLINTQREQMVDLLVSTYQETLRMNEELQARQREISHANQVLRSLNRIVDTLLDADTAAEIGRRALAGLVSLPAFAGGWIDWYDEPLPTQAAGSVNAEQVAEHGASGCQPSGSPGVKPCPTLGGEPHASASLRVDQLNVGAIHVVPAHGVRFGEAELKILGTIASQISIALARVRLLASLKQRAVQLESANRELESFSYSVSHDLRSPLRAIDGFSRLLQTKESNSLSSEGLRLLNVIRDSTSRMNQLINDLLAFSHLNTAKLATVEFDITAQVRNVFEEVRGECEGKPVDFSLRPLPPAFGDRSLLRQVWTNLLSNAIKYSGQRERIEIEVSGIDSGIETIYAVADHGAGFNMAYYDKLFGVFQRLHSDQQFQGTGIGLANVKRIVSRHGGRVWADGRPGEGATFYFSLPKGNVAKSV